jgi:uncharacterized protein YukE
MATYSVFFSEIETEAGNMSKITAQINNFLQELQTGTMKAIIEWESVAADEFNNQRAIWAQGASDMTVQAANAQTALQNIIAEYAQGENVGVQIWAGKG